MDKTNTSRHSPLTTFVDDLQARGRYTFTRAEAAHGQERSPVALEAALRRLKQRGRIVSPRRGFYVLVPIEYRQVGCPPATWFIADLMRFLGQPYYVGLLSAAALHGAAHQQPMVFQVITDRPTRPAVVGRVQIRFHVSRHIEVVPVVAVQTETGSLRASTPEATAFDLIRFAPAAGHLSNVATVLAELAEKLDPVLLAALASSYAVPEVQRLGYLLEQLGEEELARPLADWLGTQRHRSVLLALGQSNSAALSDRRWRIVLNETVEMDL